MAGLFSRLKQRNKAEHPYCAAVVAAAGAARRMEGIDKILADLGGVPILARTLLALERCEKIDEIIIVTRSDLCVPVGKLCRTFAIDKAKAVVQGGNSRAESVRLGLRAISKQAELAAIHDGALYLGGCICLHSGGGRSDRRLFCGGANGKTGCAGGR